MYCLPPLCLPHRSAPELHGPWKQHPRSPLSVGSSALLAGPLTVHNGQLLRFARDCQRTRGAHKVGGLTARAPIRGAQGVSGVVRAKGANKWKAMVPVHPWGSGWALSPTRMHSRGLSGTRPSHSGLGGDMPAEHLRPMLRPYALGSSRTRTRACWRGAGLCLVYVGVKCVVCK